MIVHSHHTRNNIICICGTFILLLARRIDILTSKVKAKKTDSTLFTFLQALVRQS